MTYLSRVVEMDQSGCVKFNTPVNKIWRLKMCKTKWLSLLPFLCFPFLLHSCGTNDKMLLDLIEAVTFFFPMCKHGLKR